MNGVLLSDFSSQEIQSAIDSMSTLRPQAGMGSQFCSILYKIISIVLVNMFKRILHVYIDKVQHVFMPVCFITDNFLIAYKKSRSHHEIIGVLGLRYAHLNVMGL
ncbi:hypothetical protein J1N35_040732 [Gossypium stocksii]|uniref:Reverse transcriptase domain-containing protein n=1 Tax=Gossypium stocksii TaxID=47602 RepID=A0A9D3UE54_9ROSI|nr:hypothetical protein J1N35_040732 [Gossypium stocksii]